MAARIEVAAITVPAGTVIAAPQVTVLALGDAIMERIEIRIPPGPSGLMGFAILHSGQQVIPFATGQWVVADDEVIDWAVEDYPTGDKWSVQAYNIDVYPHTLYCRFFLREIPAPAAPAKQPVVVVASGGAQQEGAPA